MKQNILTKLFSSIDARIKFPHLKKGDTGVQIGFDLSSKTLATDVLKMYKRVGKKGKVIAIDPDPENIKKLKKIVDKNNLPITLIQKGTFSEPGSTTLTLGTRSSYNKIDNIEADNSKGFTERKLTIELDTVDNILNGLGIDINNISHIGITNNGAEYATLLGMTDTINSNQDLTITLATGRPGKMGKINGQPDHEVIEKFLKQRNFTCRFMRMNQSFWWGFVVQFCIKQKWIFGKMCFGVIMAAKGNHKIRFYQTFS